MKAEIILQSAEQPEAVAPTPSFHPSSFAKGTQACILHPFVGCVLIYSVGLVVSGLVAGGELWHIAGLTLSIIFFWLCLWLAQHSVQMLYRIGLGLVMGLALLGLLTLPHLDDDYLRFNALSRRIIEIVASFSPHLEWLVMHRNTLAGMLAVFGILSLSYSLFGVSRLARWLGGVAALAMFGSLLVTNSRGGLAAFVVGLAILIGLTWRKLPRLRTGLTVVSLGLVVLGAIYLIISEQYRLFAPERLLSENGISRLELWQRTLYMLGDAPLTGFGPGHFRAFYPFYVDVSAVAGNNYQEHAHNLFLQSYAELGLAGLLAMLWATVWWALVLGRVMGGRLSPNFGSGNPATTLLMGGLAAFGALLAYGLTEHSTWNGQFAPLFWIPLAFVAAALPLKSTSVSRFWFSMRQRMVRPWTIGAGALGLVLLGLLSWQLWGLALVNAASLDKLKVWQGQADVARLEHARQLYQSASGIVDWTNVPTRGLAWIALRQDKLEEAEGYLHEVVRRDPSDKSSLLMLGDLLEGRGQHGEAVALWRQAKAAPLFATRGQYLLDTPADKTAEAYLLRAIEIDPKLWDGYSFLVILYQRYARTPEAIAVLEKARQFLPDDPRPIAELAKLGK
jgi:tetratricopeptide (TPR) repeat protein